MKRLTGIAALVAALACGDSTSSRLVPCSSDAECKAGRKCVEGYCESGGETVNGDSSADPCADSPLTGKYLVRVDYCNTYSLIPFSNCQGQIRHIESMTSSGAEDVEVTVDVTYQRTKIFFPATPLIDVPAPFTYELVEEFSDSDIVIDEACASHGDYEMNIPGFTPENDIRLLKCVLSRSSELYTVKIDGIICPSYENFFELSDAPFAGENNCNNRYEAVFKPIRDACYSEIYQ